MHVTYIPCHTKAELCAQMKQLSEAPEGEAPSFLEATVYSKETSVIMLGEFDDCDTPEKKRKVNRINDWWQPWYYTHVEKALTHSGFDEYIPVRHYHHRCVSCMHRLSVCHMHELAGIELTFAHSSIHPTASPAASFGSSAVRRGTLLITCMIAVRSTDRQPHSIVQTHPTRPRALPDLIPFGNHPLYRYLLGWLGAPKVSLIKKTMSPQIRREVVYKHVVQVR